LADWDRLDRGGVYLDTWKPTQANLHFVFCDKRALAAVRFRSFLRDCRAIEQPVDELDRAVEQE